MALQRATDGQSNLLLLTLTQDTTEVAMPIGTNMLSLAIRTVKYTLKISHTHTVRHANVHIHKLTLAPSMPLIHVTHTHILIISHDDWFQSAKL